MSRLALLLITIVILLAGGYLFFTKRQTSDTILDRGRSTVTMQITSPAFEHNGMIPDKYTCKGENINPPLMFSNIPKGAQSLALIMDDPDAVTGIWDHWLVVNISLNTAEVSEGSVPAGGTQIKNSFGKVEYGGPCPPDEPIHHYRFKLYALDTKLNHLPLGSKRDIENAMQGHILASAELIGLYQK